MEAIHLLPHNQHGHVIELKRPQAIRCDERMTAVQQYCEEAAIVVSSMAPGETGPQKAAPF